MDNNFSQSEGFHKKVTGFLERKPVIYQFLRFGCIGFLNTALNFLILNTVSKALGITEGWPLGGVAALAFVGAVIQSYTWNRTWTFGRETGVSLWQNVVRLFFVGLLIFWIAFVDDLWNFWTVFVDFLWLSRDFCVCFALPRACAWVHGLDCLSLAPD